MIIKRIRSFCKIFKFREIEKKQYLEEGSTLKTVIEDLRAELQ